MAGVVPVFGGGVGVWKGAAMLSHGAGADLDSHVRYLSGLLLGIGLTFWSLVPNVERRGTVFRLLTAIVFVGGVSRLAGAISSGLAPEHWPMPGALVMELIVTPALAAWQARVSARRPKTGSLTARESSDPRGHAFERR
jgi:hypothetical protein